MGATLAVAPDGSFVLIARGENHQDWRIEFQAGRRAYSLLTANEKTWTESCVNIGAATDLISQTLSLRSASGSSVGDVKALSTYLSTAKRQLLSRLSINKEAQRKWTSIDRFNDGATVRVEGAGRRSIDTILKKIDASGTLLWTKKSQVRTVADERIARDETTFHNGAVVHFERRRWRDGRRVYEIGRTKGVKDAPRGSEGPDVRDKLPEWTSEIFEGLEHDVFSIHKKTKYRDGGLSTVVRAGSKTSSGRTETIISEYNGLSGRSWGKTERNFRAPGDGSWVSSTTNTSRGSGPYTETYIVYGSNDSGQVITVVSIDHGGTGAVTATQVTEDGHAKWQLWDKDGTRLDEHEGEATDLVPGSNPDDEMPADDWGGEGGGEEGPALPPISVDAEIEITLGERHTTEDGEWRSEDTFGQALGRAVRANLQTTVPIANIVSSGGWGDAGNEDAFPIRDYIRREGLTLTLPRSGEGWDGETNPRALAALVASIQTQAMSQLSGDDGLRVAKGIRANMTNQGTIAGILKANRLDRMPT
jgi:hypothetical protein